MKILNWIALILLIVGGLNWGLIGFFQYDLVGTIFGSMTMITRVIFGIVGIAAVYGAYAFPMLMRKMQSAPKA